MTMWITMLYPLKKQERQVVRSAVNNKKDIE